MGTNFYWKKDQDSPFNPRIIDNIDDPRIHIGKRSAAGLYCWDCGTTLCETGVRGVHHVKPWHDKCPICGRTPNTESLDASSVGTELGFNKNDLSHKGVGSCASFTWTAMKHREKIIDIATSEMPETKVIIDEYGRGFTPSEFLKILEDCPIQFQTPVIFS